MALDLLKRKLAPVLPAAFSAVDTEAARVLKLNLAGRRIVDFRGPHGWELAAVNTGRLTMISPLRSLTARDCRSRIMPVRWTVSPGR